MTAEEETAAKESNVPEVGGIDKMYQIYEKLNAAEDKAALEGEYRHFMEAAHRSDKEKRLASQFITRFIEFFPKSYDDAVGTMLDLCDEEDQAIRKQVIKDLFLACKKVKPSETSVPRIVDVFCQLLLTADVSETQTLEANIQSLFNTDARGTLAGIFVQFRDGDETVREAVLKILIAKIKENNPDVAKMPFQQSLYQEIKQVAKYMTDVELKTLLDLFHSQKFLPEVNGNSQIVDLLYEKLSLKEMLKVDVASIRSLHQTTDKIMTLLNTTVLPNTLIVYYFTKVVPVISKFGGEEKCTALQLDTMKRIAELLLLAKTIEEHDAKICLDSAFNLALELLPPADSEQKVNFSLVECSLFFIYQLGGHLPSYIPSSERMDDLTTRLVAFHRPITSHKENLRQAFKTHELKPMDLTELQNKKKIIALKVFKNLDILTRALLEDEIKYGQKIPLSWKPLTQPQPAPAPKRSYPTQGHLNVVGGLKNPRPGKDRELKRYQPPGGKYSRGGAFGSYGGGGRGGGGGFGRGGFARGRGGFRGNNRRF